MGKLFAFLFLSPFVVMQCAFAGLPQEVSGLSVVNGKNVVVKSSTKGLVVTFLSAKCPCSDSHLEVLKKLAGQFKDFNFVAIHSNADETAELTKEYFVRAKLPFEIIQDKDSTLANKFKALKTPHVFVIGSNGEVQFQGGVTESANAATAKKNYLEDALADLQAGKPVAVATGRTLGCMIQRSGDGNSW